MGEAIRPSRGQPISSEGKEGQALAERKGSTKVVWGFAVADVLLLLKGSRSSGTEGTTVWWRGRPKNMGERADGWSELSRGRMKCGVKGSRGSPRELPIHLYPRGRKWGRAVAQAA